MFPSSTKREFRHFHVVVGQWRQRNVQKKRDARAKLLFCESNLLLFCRSRCRPRRRCLSSLLTWVANVKSTLATNHSLLLVKVTEQGQGQGWRSTRLPPMWPGFESWRRRHMWVEFVVGSLLCSERFFSGYSGFPLSSKTNTSKFQFDLERTDTFQRVLMNSLVLRG